MSNNTDLHKEKKILIEVFKAGVFGALLAKYAEQCKTDKERQQFTDKFYHNINTLYDDINPDNMTSSELIKILVDLYAAATGLINWNDKPLKILLTTKCIKFAVNERINSNKTPKQHH